MSGPPWVKPSKYLAKKTTYNGVLYASKAEAHRATELDLMVRSGGVLWWIGQPTFRLGCAENKYTPDFLVVSAYGTYVIDVKGFETTAFKRNKRLWRAHGPCPLHVMCGKKLEIITPNSLAESEAAS